MSPAPDAALALRGVSLRRGERTMLADIDWEVRAGQRWVVLGRNGSGKTSLVRIASLTDHPSTGVVEVLGQRLGHTDVRRLRPRIGLASAAVADRLRPGLAVHDVVMTARHGALEPWWDRYDDADRDAAEEQLDRLGIGHLADQAFATLSSGERQRVLLARTLVGDPGLLLLDEPTAGLDLGGREELLAALGALAADAAAPPVVLVTHHLEEVPSGFTHALLLGSGRILSAGPLEEVLRAEPLGACFGLELIVERHGSRWSARAR